MSTLLTIIVLASLTNGSAVQTAKAVNSPKTEPALRAVPKPPNGLTLYNASGDVVARCGRNGDSFGNCKMEPGVSLDEVMNAWVHAYQDSQK